MGSFDSPLGSKKFAGQPMREFDVPDESENSVQARRPRPNFQNQELDMNSVSNFQHKVEGLDDAEIERQIREARDAKRSGKERLNEGAKRRIEMLVGMTRTSREVNLENNIFILQSMKSKDMREAIMLASQFDGTVQSPFEIRRQLLARSLVQVAGVDFAQFVGSNTLEAKLEFIDEQDEHLLNRLYDEYLELTRDSKNKYAIKNVEDVKDLIDDLKK